NPVVPVVADEDAAVGQGRRSPPVETSVAGAADLPDGGDLHTGGVAALHADHQGGDQRQVQDQAHPHSHSCPAARPHGATASSASPRNSSTVRSEEIAG